MNAVRHHADYRFLFSVLALIFFGLIMLTSASSALGYEKFGDSYFYVKRQLLNGVLPGLVAFLFFSKIPYPFLKKISKWMFYLAITLLILVFLPGIGSANNTFAKSWIVLFGISFQPIEFTKLALILFLASHLSEIGEKLQNAKEGFLVTLGLAGIPIILLIAQPDIGGVVLLFTILYSLLFLAGAKIQHILLLTLAGVVAFVGLIFMAPYRAARLTTFLHPELDPQGIGYHINQAYLAIGSGGIFGLGLGHSRQKFQYLPEVHADSIFAIIAEEMGFVIAAGFIIFLLYIAKRGLTIARAAPDEFGRLAVSGIIIWLLVQSFFNIAAMLGLMPITGLPLPFVSHGGTSYIFSLAAIGVIANVSQYMREKDTY